MIGFEDPSDYVVFEYEFKASTSDYNRIYEAVIATDEWLKYEQATTFLTVMESHGDAVVIDEIRKAIRDRADLQRRLYHIVKRTAQQVLRG